MEMEVAREAVEKLSAAGFAFRGVMETLDDLPPVNVVSYMSNLGPDSGRHGFLLAHDEQDLSSRFNEEWERLARESGLFSEGAEGRPEFLIGVDTVQDTSEDAELQSWRWVRVALADGWDIAGAGCENGILGAGANNPAFIMMSLDGEVLMGGAYWQDGIGATALTHPARLPELREHARRIAVDFDWLEPEQRQWAGRWLEHVTAQDR
ncbi:hypothetical protein ACIGW4_02985 [Streptomyces sp. NPDC053513]|uniref:hypothetical protein n=1 Tax=unclassified Streptomyces TaxID=2593676 RepID=UPI0037CE2F38